MRHVKRVRGAAEMQLVGDRDEVPEADEIEWGAVSIHVRRVSMGTQKVLPIDGSISILKPGSLKGADPEDCGEGIDPTGMRQRTRTMRRSE